MSQDISILLSAAELRMLMAASGLNRALLFHYGDKISRKDQLQAINTLVNDGLFVCEKESMRPNVTFLEFINILRDCEDAVVAIPEKDTSPQMCIYHGRNSGLYLGIVPLESKKECYKVFSADPMGLMNSLEQIKLIPSVDEEIDAQQPVQKSSGIDDKPLSKFQRWSISKSTQTDSLTILRRAGTWLIRQENLDYTKMHNYSAECVLAWLKGELA